MSCIHTELAKDCVEKILQASKHKKPLLVATTGDSGSGKSYFSKLIYEEFANRQIRATYIDADDFLISRAHREVMKHKFYESGEFIGKSYYEILENMFDLDKFQQVLKDLRNNQSSTYFPYSRTTGTVLRTPKTVHPSEIILFDTSMLVHLFDYVILVEVDRHKILERKVARDSDIRTPAEIIEMHQKVQGFYWDRAKPKEPNIIIDNNQLSQPRLVKK